MATPGPLSFLGLGRFHGLRDGSFRPLGFSAPYCPVKAEERDDPPNLRVREIASGVHIGDGPRRFLVGVHGLSGAIRMDSRRARMASM